MKINVISVIISNSKDINWKYKNNPQAKYILNFAWVRRY